mmetsp:Transcript_13897/g.18999  ORF Transcript_13897/g.18999 Transcript_13897/m.18999 type:complete len:256 (-) Transcript_13897:346-1113(-)|eukprot:CAMPEP_0170076374 /NCGR_PEP_ID=MMETSP0019_2-20121128/13350_1 /TAXON_ID=98059 /ORGANISM="Dinobryon sp., Strain UTEXLB2267" /LENGTH=255 /DNA_ID=CAMNT_0010287957 /DNA_START=106 /DNA_END=873 /DNA_ORIENTATION=-
MSAMTVEDINKLNKPTDGFLCPLTANTFGIEFLSFTISDYNTKKVIFEVGRDNPTPQDISVDFSTLGEDMYRRIKYNFSEDVLRLPLIQTSLVFSVGNREINGFRMIERHYFRDQLVKSFDFAFGFCIPGSTNTWDSVYSMPPLSSELINEMIENPYETKSDSFYFVNGKLIMHNKASYKYFREDGAQSKKSYEDKFGAKGAKAAKAAKESKVSDLDNFGEMKVAESKEVAGGARSASAKGASKDGPWSKEADYN